MLGIPFEPPKAPPSELIESSRLFDSEQALVKQCDQSSPQMRRAEQKERFAQHRYGDDQHTLQTVELFTARAWSPSDASHNATKGPVSTRTRFIEASALEQASGR